MNTNYFMNCVAGNVFRTKTSPAIPTKYYIGLSKTAPSVSGTNVTEPSGLNYSRVDISSLLGAPSNGVVKNTSSIEFPESSGAWGVITHFVVYDAQTGGNLLMYGALTASRTVEESTIMIIRTGELVLSVENPT